MPLAPQPAVPSPELGSYPVDVEQLGDRLSELRLREPVAVERMRQSLSRHGQLSAVTVFDDGELLQVVDGFKRLHAAQYLGWARVRVSVVSLSEAQVPGAIVTLHQRHELTDLEEGWLVRWLYREHGLSQGAIAQQMGKHKSWVSRRLMLVESLEEVVQADVRLGLLCPRAALTVAELPRGNPQQAAELIASRGMTTRQAERLVQYLRTLESDAARQRAMPQWSDRSVAAKDPPKPARPRSEGEQLMADVATLLRVGVRVEVRLLQGRMAGLGADGREQARATLTELGALLGSLGRAIARAVETKDKLDATLAHP